MTHGEAVALSVAGLVLCVALVIVYVVVGRKRWSLVREGWCQSITYHDWVWYAGTCQYTGDDLYTDETDTDIHFEDGLERIGCKFVRYNGPLPARVRLEANWLGAYRIVAVDEIEKAA
ncbi:MAG: hypothetical protein QY323_05420 [Patescibacteria group bacterium]|nr:MAG: hypothetical protein QY323_05420 [Patescibacteria group bacterium]